MPNFIGKKRRKVRTWTVLVNKGVTKSLMSRGRKRSDPLRIFSSCSGRLRNRRSRSRAKCCSDAMRCVVTQPTWIVQPVATNRRRSLWPQVKQVIGAWIIRIKITIYFTIEFIRWNNRDTSSYYDVTIEIVQTLSTAHVLYTTDRFSFP